MGSPEEALSDSLCRIAFYRAAHSGFIRAQASIINRILSIDQAQLGWQDELTFRKIIDAIAWQILDRQLYVARRLCRDQRPVPLRKRSDLKSVIDAATNWQKDDLTRFALISDASTFINVGDLLVTEPLDGYNLAIMEVKTGDVNQEILELLYSIPNVSGEQLETFLSRRGNKGFDQLGRVVRQTMRMTHIAEVFNIGESQDPDSSERIKVTEDKIEAETYDQLLSKIFERARQRAWDIEIIDDCLVVGVFRGSTILQALKIFRSWLRLAGWSQNFFKCDLVESMSEPLALPLFSREIEPENIFDVLFGRAMVLMAFNLDKFIDLSNKIGVPMRWSSRKMAASMPKSKIGIKVDNWVLLAGEGAGRFVVDGGYVTRIFFHGITPRFMIELLGRRLASPSSPASFW